MQVLSKWLNGSNGRRRRWMRASPEGVECKEHVSHIYCSLVLDYGLQFRNYIKNIMSRLVSQPR